MKNSKISRLLMVAALMFTSAVVTADPTYVSPEIHTVSSGGPGLTISQLNTNFTATAGAVDEANFKYGTSIIDWGGTPNCTTGLSGCYLDGALAKAVGGLGTWGGNIRIPAGSWVINATPETTFAADNVIFDIDPTATFTSTTWPRDLLAVKIQPLSTLANFAPSGVRPSGGGFTGVAYDFTQLAGTTGWDSVAVYSAHLESEVNSPTYGGLSAVKILSESDTGTTGKLYGIDIVHTTNSIATTNDAPVHISGTGTVSSAQAIDIDGTRPFTTGVNIKNAINGITIASSATGVVIGTTNSYTGTYLNNNTTGILVSQIPQTGTLTEGDMYVGVRNSDSSPSGNFLTLLKNDATSALFKVDNGGAVHIGNGSGGFLVLSDTYVTAPAGSGTGYISAVMNNVNITIPFTYSGSIAP